MTAPLRWTYGTISGWLDPVTIMALTAIVVLGVVIIVWSRRRQKKRAVARDDEALALHHARRWAGDYHRFVPEPRHWGLALAAPYALCHEENWDELRHQDVQKVREVVADSWGIQGRLTMLWVLYGLLVGGHRRDFGVEIATWSAMSARDARRFEKKLRSGVASDSATAERLWRFRRVRANDRDIRRADFLAWDFVRAAMLARAGATAGYLSDAEAQDFHVMLAADLRRHYRSWEELGESFHLGRWYWNSQDGEGEASTDRHDSDRQSALLAEDGPWRAVPWDLAVPRPRMLFADALSVEAPKWATDVEDETAMSEWHRRLAAEVAARQTAASE